MTNNKLIMQWVDEVSRLVKPKHIVWIDGSEQQLETLRQQAVAEGELIKLNQELLPGCYLHRSNQNDVARVEDRTFVCTNYKIDSYPVNNWISTADMKAKLTPMFDGVMKERTMYIIPYCMGPSGSVFSKPGIEITDSIYVVLSMAIMTRTGKSILDKIDKNHYNFVRCLHSKAQVSAEDRYIAHFPEENSIWSINSAYGGNALLSKKSFALRMASYKGWKEGWFAEHMLILGIENPQGEIKYIAAAFPSACGKTNLAMLVPPKHLAEKGYKVWTLGDDIAWMHIGQDGRLYAVNPEAGFFGVAPGTSLKSNPNAMLSTKKNTIFTNVVQNLDNNTVWWEGYDKNPPENALDWTGKPWNGKTATTKGAHPNSRFTSPVINCPSLSKEYENTEGVPISAIVFGGRRAKTAPLVYQSFGWNHGVYIGSTMASETTAATTGKVGVTRRDPMAMLPFVGYNMGDYFEHWLEMGKEMGTKAPKIFHVNWFRTDDEGKFIWPGFGDNLRVLNWIIDRCENKIGAKETPIGYMPFADDIDLEGLDNFSLKQLCAILEVDKELWLKETDEIKDFYNFIGRRMPQELYSQLGELEKRLK